MAASPEHLMTDPKKDALPDIQVGRPFLGGPHQMSYFSLYEILPISVMPKSFDATRSTGVFTSSSSKAIAFGGRL